MGLHFPGAGRRSQQVKLFMDGDAPAEKSCRTEGLLYIKTPPKSVRGRGRDQDRSCCHRNYTGRVRKHFGAKKRIF
jgi:hypothetical protein